VQVIPHDGGNPDSTQYVMLYGPDSTYVQLDFGDMSYQPPADSQGLLTRPTTNQFMHVVAGLLYCPFAPMNHAIVYEMNSRLWRVPGDTSGFGSVPTEMSARPRGVPTTYLTLDNFPNPFNSATTITYSLPSASSVSLIIMDALGRQVTRVCDAHASAGTHSFSWDGTGRSSGIYFCRITSEKDCVTRRMVLLK
jgi:hypothetical protein